MTTPGQGLGKAPIADVARLGWEHGFSHLTASVEDANEKSLAMHRHLEAEKIGSFERDNRPYSVVAFDLA
ncbi:hypothetical protein [Rothia sp. ZJ1223]|uniref:hypothetical protein n=1 Tax=Rothia sp. ZJ1223 TaxID=2811098 RepID=UPI00195C518D|nr:hypothetical protein [Rothia sp. ZJ1223]MBM7050918.1 hypothetical protein [Rothia sp. ZJ1223]